MSVPDSKGISLMPALHTMQDEAAIRQLVRDMESAWNRADSYAFARVFVEDGEFRSVWGQKVYRREAITEDHRHLFTTQLRNSQIEVQIAGIRFLRQDVAYLETISQIHHENNPFAWTIGAAIIIKEAGIWRIVTLNNAGLSAGSPNL